MAILLVLMAAILALSTLILTSILPLMALMGIMPSVPGPEGFPEDRGVLRSLLSALAFDNISRGGSGSVSLRGSMAKRSHLNKRKRKPRRRDCLGRSCKEDDTVVDENESSSEHMYGDTMDSDLQQQFIVVDPSFVDIFYDAKDREAEEALLDELSRLARFDCWSPDEEESSKSDGPKVVLVS